MAFIAILAAFSIGKRYVSQEIAGKAIDRIYFRPLRLPAWQHHPAKPFLVFNTMSGTENPHQKKGRTTRIGCFYRPLSKTSSLHFAVALFVRMKSHWETARRWALPLRAVWRHDFPVAAVRFCPSADSCISFFTAVGGTIMMSQSVS